MLLQAAAAAARQTPPGHGPFFAIEIENIDIYGSPPNPVVTYWLGDGVTGRLAWLNGRYAGSLPQALLFGYGFTWATLQRLPTAPGQLQADIVIPSPTATPRSRWTLPGVSRLPRGTPERRFVIAGPLFVCVGLRGLA